MLSNPDWQGYQFFNLAYDADKAYNSSGMVECYYLKDVFGSTAIGWVHNRRGWIMNNYYHLYSNENFLGCDPPTGGQTILLDGLMPTTMYHVTWFPTHMNSTVMPDTATVTTNALGELLLDTSSEPFGGVVNNYLDTLRSDYAFIVAPQPILRSMHATAMTMGEWDFTVFPNPTRDVFNLRFADESSKSITLCDVVGRCVLQQSNVLSPLYTLPVGNLSPGAYWLTVQSGRERKVRKLIIQ